MGGFVHFVIRARGFVLEGFCHRGFCPRGFCPRGFCPRGVLSVYRNIRLHNETRTLALISSNNK